MGLIVISYLYTIFVPSGMNGLQHSGTLDTSTGFPAEKKRLIKLGNAHARNVQAYQLRHSQMKLIVAHLFQLDESGCFQVVVATKRLVPKSKGDGTLI